MPIARAAWQRDMQKTDCGAWLKSEIGDRPLYWCPNPGNAGDHLIAVATERLFRAHGIDARLISDPDAFDSTGKIVCYGGGGNFVPSYHRARDFIARHHESADRFIVLPHTVSGNEELLGRLGPNTTIFCRELISLAHCQKHAPGVELLLGDDLAFALDLRNPASQVTAPSFWAAPRTYLYLQNRFWRFCKATQGETRLDAWRGDRERHPMRISDEQHDLSRLFALRKGPQLFDQRRLSAYFFLEAVKRFSSVHTDRLHVAIAGALLGKDVRLYGNSYYKNRAVYELSLRRFPKVAFVDISHAVAPSLWDGRYDAMDYAGHRANASTQSAKGVATSRQSGR